MSFREQVQQDIHSVFLNPDEFAEIHEIDGVDVACIVTDNDSMAASSASDGFANVAGIGIIQCDRVVLCKTSDLPKKPVAGQRLRMDGCIWLVQDGISEDMGMLTLPLNRAY